MSNKEDIPTCPVTDWSIFTVPSFPAIAIQFDFLTHQLQQPHEANHSPNFLLTPEQARELAQKIEVAFQKLQSAGFQKPPGDPN